MMRLCVGVKYASRQCTPGLCIRCRKMPTPFKWSGGRPTKPVPSRKGLGHVLPHSLCQPLNAWLRITSSPATSPQNRQRRRDCLRRLLVVSRGQRRTAVCMALEICGQAGSSQPTSFRIENRKGAHVANRAAGERTLEHGSLDEKTLFPHPDAQLQLKCVCWLASLHVTRSWDHDATAHGRESRASGSKSSYETIAGTRR